MGKVDEASTTSTARPKRTRRLIVEKLESRELPAVSPLLGARPAVELGSGLSTVAPAVQAQAALTNPTSDLASRVSPALLASFVKTLYGPVNFAGNAQFPAGSYPVPQPTPAEIRRETFYAKFSGFFYVGPPRFSDQAATIHFYSKGNGLVSNQFLKGRASMVLFPPADPSAQPNPAVDPVAGQTVGVISIVPTNFLQTSNQILLDVTGPAGNQTDPTPRGLPTRVTFFLDTTGAGGFTNPAYQTTPLSPFAPLEGGSGGVVAFNQGVGIITISYVPDPRPRPGYSITGKAVVTIEGLINGSEALNPIAKEYM